MPKRKPRRRTMADQLRRVVWRNSRELLDCEDGRNHWTNFVKKAKAFWKSLEVNGLESNFKPAAFLSLANWAERWFYKGCHMDVERIGITGEMRRLAVRYRRGRVFQVIRPPKGVGMRALV